MRMKLKGWHAKTICTAILAFPASVSFAIPALASDLKHPDWRPDGEALIAEGSCKGGIDLYFIDLPANKPRRIWDSGDIDGYPRWFPDGQKIVFHQINRDAKTSGIFVANIAVDGGLANVALVSDGQYNIEPSPSPDGAKLAHSSWGGGSLDIAMSKASGDILQSWPTSAKENFPSWTPDGNNIIYHASVGDEFAQILMRNIDDSTIIQMTTSHGPNMTPHMRPDGKLLAFASERDGDRELYLMDIGTRHETRLTRREGRDGYPKFSPDGRRIAYHSVVSENSTVIRVVDLDGHIEREISCADMEEEK